MKKNINHPLSAILTFNTVANVIGAAGVGAQAYALFGSEWVAITSGILTILILVFSEIIPKTVGVVYWKHLAPPAAYVLKGLIISGYPIVVILESISRFIARKGSQPEITRDEIRILSEIGEKEGILLKKEARIMKNLFLLAEMQTVDILTPRSVIFAVQKDQTVKEVINTYSPIPFSRIPVYRESLDDIIGTALRKELLEAFHSGRLEERIENFSTPIFAIPESKSVADLLDEFINRREHIFLVIDEYGGTEGIVTLEDTIETLLGVEIVDEFDNVEDMREYALKKWKQHHRKHTAL